MMRDMDGGLIHCPFEQAIDEPLSSHAWRHMGSTPGVGGRVYTLPPPADIHTCISIEEAIFIWKVELDTKLLLRKLTILLATKPSLYIKFTRVNVLLEIVFYVA